MALKIKNRMIQRKMAVIESPAGVVANAQSQLIMATAQELEMYRKSFPYLVVRWAEPEDRAKWQISDQIFNEDRK